MGATESRANALRDHFLGWQCRIRQIAIRDCGGRPSSGMTPALQMGDGESAAGSIVVLIVERDPSRATDQLRHICRQTQDPRARYTRGLGVLSTGFFQFPSNFSDAMTAQFEADSRMAARLLEAGHCTLVFEQFNQRYRIPCAVSELESDDASYQWTHWHNHLFSPRASPGGRVLAFEPDWEASVCDPPPPVECTDV